MRKKFFYLVAMITSFVFTVNAQDCTSLTLTVGGGDYDSEITWQLGDGAEELVGSYDVCLSDGLYTMNMFDSWGDGWNGATWEMLNSEGDTVASGGLSEGAAASQDFTIGEVAVAGCTDSEALNYNEMATEDDGSCEYPADGSVTITCDGGSWQSEVTWSITDCDGNMIAEGGAPFSGLAVVPENAIVSMADAYGDGWNGNVLTVGDLTFELTTGASGQGLIGVCGTPGCMDATASNYNADATIDDGSCAWECPLTAGGVDVTETTCYNYVWNYGYTVEEVESYGYDCSCVEAPINGCMDPDASNYDETATQAGSCTYDCAANETELELTMNDSYGDGWNGATMTIGDLSFTGPAADTETTLVCVDLSACNAIIVGGGSYDSEIGWTLGDMSGGAPYEGTIGECGSDDYSCDDAVAMDGSASGNTGGNAWHSFTMAADGSATISVDEDASDFGVSVSLSSDCEGTDADAAALTAGTYFINVTQNEAAAEAGGSDYSISVAISILGCTDGGAANFDANATEDDGSCEYIFGCTDPIASNYDETASTDDGSCEYVLGCTDNTAVNYDPAATEDDGTCTYVECEQTSALLTLNTASWGGEVSISITDVNYQELAFIQGDANDATYNVDMCLSDANVYTAILADSYGDGWNGGTFSVSTCDGSLVAAEGGLIAGSSDTIVFTIQTCDTYTFGCTDSAASNYDEAADTDDGSCTYPGCTDEAYVEFDANANLDDGSCATLIISGCMDASAPNYDETANVDDGSCVLPIDCEEGLSGMVITMNDSYGDGWNGNEYSLVNASGEVVATGGLPSEGFTITPEGTSGADTLCVPAGCYAMTVAGGSYITETSWSAATEHNGDAIANGGGNNDAVAFGLGTDDDCSTLLGCNDPYATNYDEAAIASDGSCEYLSSENCEDAIAMDVNSSYNGNFGEQAWFSITLDSEQFVSASADPAAGFYYVGDIAMYADSCGGDAVEAGGLAAGTYLIEVSNSSIWANGDGYVLTVNASDIVSGCTDIYADNYNADANVDDESCLYPCDGIAADMNITTGTYAYEVYWELVDSTGMIAAFGGGGDYINNTDYSAPLCLSVGMTYTMNSYDAWGDGWNGGTYSIVAECGDGDDAFTYVAANNGGESPSDLASVSTGDYHLEASESFTMVACDAVVAGCMDETAFNYNADANVSDGNCEPFVYGCMDADALNFDPEANTDTPDECVFGCEGEYVTVSIVLDYWGSEMTWSLSDALGNVVVAGGPYDNGLTGELDESQWCLANGTYVFDALDSYGDGWGQGGSFNLTTNCDGVDISQVGGSPSGTGESYQFDLVSCADVIAGCNDANASNYDESATHNDGSCEYAVPCPIGPVDGTVLDLATADTTIFSWDALYPQNPDFYYVFWSTDADDLVGSAAIVSNNYGTGNPTELEMTDGLYNLFIDNGYGAGDEFDLYWWVTPVYYTEEGAVDYFCGANQLTLTISAVNGCMDESALNFNPGATVDDGTCQYPCEEGLTLMMADSYGDGWNGNEFIINGVSYSLPSDGFTITPEGTSGMACVDAASCYSFGWVLGSYATETSWTLYDADAAVVAEGGAGSVPDAIGDCAYGCTDEAYAEYDATADVDDGSCATLLCTGDVVALDMIDTYGDGWNGGFLTINGADYTVDMGEAASFELCVDLSECVQVLYTAGSWSGENAWSVSAGGVVLASSDNTADYAAPESGMFGNCGVMGCTDASATNYNADATTDDGSCYYEGCMDPAADNYDANADTDDGSCYYSCADGQAQIDVLISTDTYAYENGFTLSDDEGGVYSYSFTSAQNLQTVTTTFCVDNGSDMTFVLTDSYGDGIINGGYEIYVCQESIQLDFNLGLFDAISYEFTATCGDIMGCMDSGALNYDEDATMDNGSCEYPCTALEATVVINTGGFGYEVGWFLEDAAGIQIAGYGGGYDSDASYEIDVCLEEGADYTFNMSDSYGDGWNGGTFAIAADCGDGILAEGGLESGEAGLVSFTADCGGGGPDCSAPADWAVTVTGANHTIMIPGDVLVGLADGNVLSNANVGVFFTNSNGDLQCAGYTEINGGTVQIAAMGDDTTTDEVDGLAAGEALVWMVADCNGNVMAATAEYTQGPDTYTSNGLTFVASITEVPAGPSCQTLDLPSGWSMFSTYMIADDMDMASILAPIIDNVIIAKNNAGAAYLVEWSFNGVGDLIVGQGYQIKTDAAVSLEICGAYAFPEDNPIEITAGWNMIGYLRTDAADAAAVLGDINASGNLIIAKDYNGAAYLPEWAFNGIGDMVPGQGYQLKTNEADVLQYLSNDDSYRVSSVEVTENNVSHFAKVAATDNNMTVVIEDAAWDVLPTEGAEIAAFDKAGNLVGSAIYSSPVTVVTVWGDDATNSSKDGLEVSEAVSFKVWTSGDVRDFTVAEWTEGSSSYNVDAINVASSIETYNAIADLTTDRVLVKVINILGQEVNLDDEPFKGTVLFNVYHDGSVEKFIK